MSSSGEMKNELGMVNMEVREYFDILATYHFELFIFQPYHFVKLKYSKDRINNLYFIILADTYVDGQDPKLEELLIRENGHNVLVSDMIALDRSIPDFRNDECKKKRNLKDLPKVSIIIPFYDEHISTLLRTIHSIINRTPYELLKEIILVNDVSRKHYEKLDNHIAVKGWGGLVKMIEMEEHSGVIWSRLAGARLASADVLLFMDCHVEVGYNYLPPLLEPIAKNYRMVTIPTLDIIDKNNYEILPLDPARTVFDWHFHAQRIPLNARDTEMKPDEPYFTPVIYGSTYAISQKFFWELKPDFELITHGADFLEMSFKINLCGGMTLEHPCSRIAHLYRRFPYEKHENEIDFKASNNKRVAEIWLEEYKESLYSRHPERYNRIRVDEEDIIEQLRLKKSLNCLPISYFFERLAPDMLERYPVHEYQHFAMGGVSKFEIYFSDVALTECVVFLLLIILDEWMKGRLLTYECITFSLDSKENVCMQKD